jgi:uncharacterized membrane protein
MDEVFDFRLASQSIASIVLAQDGFPPLYHLIAHGWLKLFDGALAMRALSVVLGLAAIVVTWLLGRRTGDERVGLVAAFLLAVSPVHIWYSQEARAYALYMLLAVSCLWLFFRAWDTDRPRDWLAYSAVATLAMYTHYYSVILIGTLLIIGGIEARQRSSLRGVAWSHLGIAVLTAPVLLLVREDLQLQQTLGVVRHPVDLVALSYAGFTLIAGFSLGPSLRELHYIRPVEAVREVLPWAVLIGAATLYLAKVTLRDTGFRTWSKRFGLLVVLPIGIAAALDWSLDTGFRVRYFVWCSIPLFAFLALGIARTLSRRPTLIACCALAIAATAAIANRRLLERHMNEDARGAAQYLSSATDVNAPIFVASWYMAAPLRFYLDYPGIIPVKGVAREETVATMMRAVQDQTTPGQVFWFVYSRPFDGDPRGLLLDSLTVRADLRKQAELAGMELFKGRGF